MDKTELSLYKKQIVALILIYITCMIPTVFTHPRHASMNCYENYSCKVEMKYIWSIRRSATIWLNSRTKLRFYNSDTYHSGFVNLYEPLSNGGLGTINLDPFGTDDFYVSRTYEEAAKQAKAMQEDISRFDRYIKREEPTFEMSKDYDNSRLNLIGGIITLIFMGFALTKKPITNLFKFVGILFRAIFTRRY